MTTTAYDRCGRPVEFVDAAAKASGHVALISAGWEIRKSVV